jgi:hypothetical protein
MFSQRCGKGISGRASARPFISKPSKLDELLPTPNDHGPSVSKSFRHKMAETQNAGPPTGGPFVDSPARSMTTGIFERKRQD